MSKKRAQRRGNHRKCVRYSTRHLSSLTIRGNIVETTNDPLKGLDEAFKELCEALTTAAISLREAFNIFRM